MDRRSFLCQAAAAGIPLAGASGPLIPAADAETSIGFDPSHTPLDRQPPESAQRIEKAAAAALSMQRRDWEQGILAQAMLEANRREQLILLTKSAIVQQTPDGRLGVVVSGGTTDPAMGGPAYAEAAGWTADPQIQRAVDRLLVWIRFKAPRSSDGVLYHVFEAPEIWSDGFNSAPPFLAAMGHYDEALTQIEGYRHRLWNPKKRLLAHIWDDGKHQFKDANFWGGGNGWAAAGLARVLRSLPQDRSQARELVAVFCRDIIDGCLQHQRPDGLFHDVVDQPATFVETNLAQMLAYSIYEGVRAAWLPAGYKAHADKMRTAARAKMDSSGFIQGACGAPDFDRPGVSTEAQAFCILMEAAGSKLEPAHPS